MMGNSRGSRWWGGGGRSGGSQGVGWWRSRDGRGLGWRLGSRGGSGRAPTSTTSPYYPYNPTTLIP